MKELKIIGWLLFLSISTYAQPSLKTEQVSDKIWVIMGSGGNIGVLEYEDGLLLVDDMFENNNEQVLEQLEGISSKKVLKVINTHFHYDHADGNKSFGNAGAEIVAHTNTLTRLKKDNTITLPGRDPHLQAQYPSYGLPVITLDKRLSINLGTEKIQIIHLSNAHTDTDVIVKFEGANVIHCGDVFVRYGVPFMDFDNGGSVNGFIEALQEIVNLSDEDTKIIPGHGNVCTKTEVETLMNNLAKVSAWVEKRKKEGASESDLTSGHPFTDVFEGSFIPLEYLISVIYQGK